MKIHQSNPVISGQADLDGVVMTAWSLPTRNDTDYIASRVFGDVYFFGKLAIDDELLRFED